AGLVLALALLVVAGGLLWWWARERRDGIAGAEGPPPGGTGRRMAIETTLYFPGPEGELVAERRRLQTTDVPAHQVWSIVRAVLLGPQNDALARPFPEDIKVGAVVLGPGGTAYVDLRAPSRRDPPHAGSTEELHMVYSLVNSVTESVPAVRSVALLWNGTQRLTFSGHLDTSRPLAADRSLVAR
ncbi:MAG TPA: GerMN domain-containing protein, partial [Thermoanaerobaculia bacterium]|nr:GerMN domain-containing protein [Thermoanaerobaculia bacterium]